MSPYSFSFLSYSPFDKLLHPSEISKQHLLKYLKFLRLHHCDESYDSWSHSDSIFKCDIYYNLKREWMCCGKEKEKQVRNVSVLMLALLFCLSRPCPSQWWWSFMVARTTTRRPPFSGTMLLQSLWVDSLGLWVSRSWCWCHESLSCVPPRKA